MSKELKHIPPIREGMPVSCIVCGGSLHRKSEHYCSTSCEASLRARTGEEAVPFLSKWKIRKIKALRDPLVDVRRKARQKTSRLVKEGRLKQKPCVVCGSLDVIAHHEDYDRPFDVIWLCELHHKQYHDGKMGLFHDKLWWNPNRLIPKDLRHLSQSRKYRMIKKNFMRKKRRQA